MMVKGKLKGSKEDSLSKDTHKSMASITIKHSLLLLDFLPSALLLAIAVEMGMQIHQMDVVTAFLNGDLKEDIYMQ